MTVQPRRQRKAQEMANFSGRRIDRGHGDIIECALHNDFRGVDRALAAEPSDINAQRVGSGITPLTAACGRGLERMVRHLLSKEGIDITLCDDFGNSALDHARFFPEIVATLVEQAYPNLKWKEPGIFPVP